MSRSDQHEQFHTQLFRHKKGTLVTSSSTYSYTKRSRQHNLAMECVSWLIIWLCDPLVETCIYSYVFTETWWKHTLFYKFSVLFSKNFLTTFTNIMHYWINICTSTLTSVIRVTEIMVKENYTLFNRQMRVGINTKVQSHG